MYIFKAQSLIISDISSILSIDVSSGNRPLPQAEMVKIPEAMKHKKATMG